MQQFEALEVHTITLNHRQRQDTCAVTHRCDSGDSAHAHSPTVEHVTYQRVNGRLAKNRSLPPLPMPPSRPCRHRRHHNHCPPPPLLPPPPQNPFEGDGMVSAITFAGGAAAGRAHFRNRFVRTKGLVKEQTAGKVLRASNARPASAAAAWAGSLMDR
jgi:Retinal pigment epithelial membrane protein